MLHVLATIPAHEEWVTQIRKTSRLTLIENAAENMHWSAAEYKDADIIFADQNHLSSSIVEMEHLRWIQLASVGYEQIYDLNLPEHGIMATNAQGVFDVPIAEWNIAMMIALARNLRKILHHQDNGIWNRSAEFQTEIRGRTVGLWGYGGIARQTARLAKAMGLNIHVLSRGPIRSRSQTSFAVEHTGDPEGHLPDRIFSEKEKMEFLASLDFLILALPLTDATRGMLGEVELKAMKPSAFLLNPARGPLVQEKPLVRALQEGWIAGAALDAHYYYPMPVEHPLWHMPNVIMTPHISGSSESTYFHERIWSIFAGNLNRFIQHQPLLNTISSESLRNRQ